MSTDVILGSAAEADPDQGPQELPLLPRAETVVVGSSVGGPAAVDREDDAGEVAGGGVGEQQGGAGRIFRDSGIVQEVVRKRINEFSSS